MTEIPSGEVDSIGRVTRTTVLVPTGDTQALLYSLAELGRGDLPVAGGKGANLGELVRAGFPVPEGFVVTTAAYDRFVGHNSLGQTIVLALFEERGNGAAIRDAFERGTIPPDVEREIVAAYRELGQGPVAVRSSATAEDLPEAAFAGQQDTFLNVVGAEAVLEAVLHCWASLWTDRAITYRERQGVDQATVKLAVVVQIMVSAESAGVMFTANPVTGARDEVVVDASPGLGEAVVSGLVTPDHFVLRKRRWGHGWRIAERRPGRREVIVQARRGGGTEYLDGADTNAAPGYALPNRALHRLARLSTAIQRHFGRPQDVEWAWADGHLFILQARPITALPSPPPRANRLQRMLAGNFAELLSIRPYPLDMTTWIPALAGAVEPVLGLLGLDWSLVARFEVKDDVVVRFKPDAPRPTWKTVLTPVRLVSLSLRYDPLHWQSDPLLAATLERVRELESLDRRRLSWEQLLATMHAAMKIPFQAAGELRRRYFPRAALAVARLRLIIGLLGHGDQLGALLSGVENKTLEVNHALEGLADGIRSDRSLANAFAVHTPEALWSALEEQPEGRAFLDELRAFLGRYGHREVIISTALQPTWKDAPEVVLGMIKGIASAEARPERKEGSRKAASEATRDDVLALPVFRIRPLRLLFLKTVAEARCLLQLREDTHFYATLALPIIRRTALELGRRLVVVGAFDVPEDVFHLKLGELREVGATWPPPPKVAERLGALVARRKSRRAALEGTPVVDPRFFRRAVPEGDALLSGAPGSPGLAEGPVRVVHDATEFSKLRSGDVLVAPYTNPAWTPLFQRAVAVVVDSGGAASHAAIVAREYGIPAVMGTVEGTSRLVDGQLVRVDGSNGFVVRADARSEQPEVKAG